MIIGDMKAGINTTSKIQLAANLESEDYLSVGHFTEDRSLCEREKYLAKSG